MPAGDHLNIFRLDRHTFDRISREMNVRPIISDFGRSIRVSQELIEVTDRERREAAEALSQTMDMQSLNTLLPPPNPGAMAPMTVCDVPHSTLTLDTLRQVFQHYCGMVPDVMLGRTRTADEVRARNEQAQRYYPMRAMQPYFYTLGKITDEPFRLAYVQWEKVRQECWGGSHE